MDEQQARQISRQIVSDKAPLPIEVSAREAWLLVLTLQTCARSTAFSAKTSSILTGVAMKFQDAIVERHPDAELVLEMGWDEERDSAKENQT